MANIRLLYTIGGQEIVVESHEQMHLDEILALWMARKFGTTEWVTLHCPDGVLRLGVGRGTFDEHPSDGSDQPDECCATLVAKSLGVADDLALKQMLKLVLNADRKGAAYPIDLHNLVKAMNLRFPDDQSRVIAWANEGIEAKYKEQLEFGPALEAVKSGEPIGFPGPKGKPVKALVVHTDNKLVMKAAQSEYGPKPDLVVQQNSRGQVQIFINKKSGLRIDRVVRYLRIAELREKRKKTDHPEQVLRQQEFVCPDDCWYYFIPGEMILNGSNTAPDVAPTKLSMEMILDCLRLGLAPRQTKQHDSRPLLTLVERPAVNEG